RLPIADFPRLFQSALGNWKLHKHFRLAIANCQFSPTPQSALGNWKLRKHFQLAIANCRFSPTLPIGTRQLETT
ncbi:MAG TPA: hypothetical protein VKB02_15795, partial [Pyrinomonadaceae bacterium]|nr:hypothetical protein [Pyrinomonadaceae bacterium]